MKLTRGYTLRLTSKILGSTLPSPNPLKTPMHNDMIECFLWYQNEWVWMNGVCLSGWEWNIYYFIYICSQPLLRKFYTFDQVTQTGGKCIPFTLPSFLWGVTKCIYNSSIMRNSRLHWKTSLFHTCLNYSNPRNFEEYTGKMSTLIFPASL